MPATLNRVDPLTVAFDAFHRAGLTLRGMDLQTYDPLRVILAERFAPEARACHGEPDTLAALIAPRLEQAVREACLQIEAEGRRMAR